MRQRTKLTTRRPRNGFMSPQGWGSKERGVQGQVTACGSRAYGACTSDNLRGIHGQTQSEFLLCRFAASLSAKLRVMHRVGRSAPALPCTASRAVRLYTTPPPVKSRVPLKKWGDLVIRESRARNTEARTNVIYSYS